MTAGTPSASDFDNHYYLSADAFFRAMHPQGLTFDDVSLATQYSEVLPGNTDLSVNITDQLKLNLPIISADMDTVTEAPMAISMALHGGMGLIHYNMPYSQQVAEVARVKNHIHGLIQEPITVSPDDTVGDVLALIERKSFNFHTFPVVDARKKLLGLLNSSVVKQRYAHKTVAEAMVHREDVYTLNEVEISNDPIRCADQFFNENMGIHKVLVVDKNDTLCGLFTLSDIERIQEDKNKGLSPARDQQFRLVCGAAISPIRKDTGEIDTSKTLSHVEELVHQGVDALAVSTAHGHTEGVGKIVRLIRENIKDITIIAGNITSAAGVRFLAEAGAHAIKVGQGPGSICTTRIIAGVGTPQMTALHITSQEAAKQGVCILADGGISKSGDMVKALTLADAVICGNILSGCPEAPGKIIEINGKLYKQYRGMGSLEAMMSGSAARYGHAIKEVQAKTAAEGIEALKEVADAAHKILSIHAGGIQSGMGYLGANNLKELKENARYIAVSAAGQKESSPHNVIEVKQTN